MQGWGPQGLWHGGGEPKVPMARTEQWGLSLSQKTSATVQGVQRGSISGKDLAQPELEGVWLIHTSQPLGGPWGWVGVQEDKANATRLERLDVYLQVTWFVSTGRGGLAIWFISCEPGLAT